MPLDQKLDCTSQDIELLGIDDLGCEDRSLWQSFVASRPDLTGPYFDIDYLQAIGKVVPNSGVARFKQDGEIVAYFPYQKRYGRLQPLGMPLSDYHAIIAKSDTLIDFDALLRATKTHRLDFQAMIGHVPALTHSQALWRRHADTRLGFEAWFEARKAKNSKFFKNIGRCKRNVEKDLGGLDFTWQDVTPHILNWVIDIKRHQYKDAGLHDVFACGWTYRLLEELAKCDTPHFGLKVGVFRHSGRIVAAEICLVNKDEVHLWFPAYDEEYARYSLGILLTLTIIENLSAQGLYYFDFGVGAEAYKSPMTTQAGLTYEGEYRMSADVAGPHMVWERENMPRTIKNNGFAQSLSRRMRIISSTETTPLGLLRAMVDLSHRACMKLSNSVVAKLKKMKLTQVKKSIFVSTNCFLASFYMMTVESKILTTLI